MRSARSAGTALLAAAAVLAAAPPRPAAAWPSHLMELLGRDARRAIPLTLARLLSEREEAILERVGRYPPELTALVTTDLIEGRLRPGTFDALAGERRAIVGLLRSQRTSEGLVRLGALLRVPADLSDPVLSAGPGGLPPGVTGQYYAFIDASLDKMAVVLSDPEALELRAGELDAYWQGLLERSRQQAPVIRDELFRQGRLVDHRTLDYRSPVFGVASNAYSRAVTAIAATWLAVWREAQGDLTRTPTPKTLRPRDRQTGGAARLDAGAGGANR